MRITGIIILIIINLIPAYLLFSIQLPAHSGGVILIPVGIYYIILFIVGIIFRFKKGLYPYFLHIFFIILIFFFFYVRQELKKNLINNVEIEKITFDKIYENGLYVGEEIKVKFSNIEKFKYVKYLYSNMNDVPKVNFKSSRFFLYPTYYYGHPSGSDLYYGNSTTIDKKTGNISYKLYLQGLIKNNNKYCYDIGNYNNIEMEFFINKKWYKNSFLSGDDKEYIKNNWSKLESITFESTDLSPLYFTFDREYILNTTLSFDLLELTKTLKSIPLCNKEDIEYSKEQLNN